MFYFLYLDAMNINNNEYTFFVITEKSEGTKVYITKHDNVDNDNLRHIKKLSKALLKHPHFLGKPSKCQNVHYFGVRTFKLDCGVSNC